MDDPYWSKCGRAVSAWVQPPGGWWIANCGVVAGPHGVLLVDTCATNARTQAFFDAVANSYRQPTIGLVNTHYHGDHTWGNHLVRGVPIYATTLTGRLIRETGLDRWPTVFKPADWGDQLITPPTVAVDQRTDLDLGGGVEAQLHPVPYLAHSPGDLVIWVPSDRALICGDLIFNGVTPLSVFGSVSGWLQALDWVQNIFDPLIVVPGHGRVCGPEIFDILRGYFTRIQALARSAVDGGESAMAVTAGADGGDWIEPDRLLPNVIGAMAEILGEPVDFSAAIRQYIKIYGGLRQSGA